MKYAPHTSQTRLTDDLRGSPVHHTKRHRPPYGSHYLLSEPHSLFEPRSSWWGCVFWEFLLNLQNMHPKSKAALIASGLEEIRRMRRMAWIVFFLFVPVIMLADLLPGDIVAPLVMGVWIILFCFSGFRVWLSRCPRCGERFHVKTWWHNIFARNCLHCRLPLKDNAR